MWVYRGRDGWRSSDSGTGSTCCHVVKMMRMRRKVTEVTESIVITVLKNYSHRTDEHELITTKRVVVHEPKKKGQTTLLKLCKFSADRVPQACGKTAAGDYQ